MSQRDLSTCTAFDGHRLIASGPLAKVALAAKRALDAGAEGPVLVFDDGSGRPVELRCFLRKGPHALTETWSYAWQP